MQDNTLQTHGDKMAQVVRPGMAVVTKVDVVVRPYGRPWDWRVTVPSGSRVVVHKVLLGLRMALVADESGVPHEVALWNVDAPSL